MYLLGKNKEKMYWANMAEEYIPVENIKLKEPDLKAKNNKT